MERNAYEYSQILESLHEGIWITDEDANTTFVNSRMAEMLGYAVDEMQGKHMFSFMDECGKAIAIRNFERRKLGVAEQHEFTFLDKNGRLIHTLVNVSPIINDKGHFAGTIAGIVDISERRRLEEALQESEEQYRDLSENANDLIQSVTPDGRFLYVNQTWRKMLGYSEEEIAALILWDIIHPDYIHHCQEVFQKVISGETMSNVEAVFVAKDGRSITVEGNINTRCKGGKIIATRGIFRDVTERKQMEKALRESEKHYRLLADNVTDIIFTMDMNLRYTYVSPSVTRLSGYSVEEATSRTLQEVLTPASFEVAMKAFTEEKVLEYAEEKDPTRSRTLELELNRKDGSTFWAEVQLTALRDHDDHPFGFVGVARDISKLRKRQ